ncbi:hypothetical protein HPB48_014055 [Haemaphysalis longicornis]|uniref:ABC transporter ATP-binding protein n=1 Tax=Haemaphysalis longicornis TaxID=44386 RepID=A0A9J6FWZ7_HAELO|nr:hypothetical protein HPB48_014055 [Haemaphysalis longicornis]
MDPEMRRSFWHLINKLRGKSTILVTTHHMEEADAIADRIIVMHSGKIICSGSPTFLKEACGVGYKLHVGKAETGLKSNEVLALIRQTVPLAVIERELDDEISIALHTFDSTGFEAMFRQLEQGATWMGIKSLSVSAATMNDAYIK